MAIFRIPAIGTLNTAIEEHLLDPSHATELLNARTDTGVVVSTKGTTLAGATPSFIANNPDGNSSVVLYNGKSYFVDNVAGTQGSSDGFLGIAPPDLLPVITPDGAGDFVGRYRFAITFETDDNLESAPININAPDFSVEVDATRTIDAGAQLLKNALEWNPGAKYSAGDIVVKGGEFFRARQSHDGTETTQRADVFQLRLFEYLGGSRRSVSYRQIGETVLTTFDPDPSLIPNLAGRLSINQRTDSFTGRDINGKQFEDFLFNQKFITTATVLTSNISEPGIGGSFTDFWDAISDETVALADGKGSASFNLTGIAVSSNSAVVRRNIYRTTAFGSTLYRTGILEDNTTTSFTDTLSDEEAVTKPTLTTINAHPPLQVFSQDTGQFEQVVGKFLTERNGVFFLAFERRTYFSEPGNPHAWNPDNWITYDENLTAQTEAPEGILAFTDNRSYIVLGDSAATILKREIPITQGCQDFRTISEILGFPIWVSNDGICVWTGNNIEIINDSIYDLDFTPTFGAVANDAYHLFGPTKTVVVDFRHQRRFYERDLAAVTVAFYELNTDTFFVKTGNQLFTLDTGSDEQFTYTTPEIETEDLNSIKHFRKLFVTADNALTIQVLFDGDTKQTITSSGTGRRAHPLVAGLTGNSIKYRVQGIGNMKSLSTEYFELQPR